MYLHETNVWRTKDEGIVKLFQYACLYILHLYSKRSFTNAPNYISYIIYHKSYIWRNRLLALKLILRHMDRCFIPIGNFHRSICSIIHCSINNVYAWIRTQHKNSPPGAPPPSPTPQKKMLIQKVSVFSAHFADGFVSSVRPSSLMGGRLHASGVL